ncbi:MAG: histidine phosphatase family protein [Lachnospiraceae bacterium]|nr:histidine phosphatase family protein [Lachnospiraceae bacterium]
MRNRTKNQITLVMLRHGAAQANREHRYLGRTDVPLCEEGKRELMKFKTQNCYPQVDCLFTSPMKRCIQTAEILYPKLCPVTVGEWTEMDFGAFEGNNYGELKEDARYQKWIDGGGTLPFPEGESREEFLLRCEKGFERMIEKLREPVMQGKINRAGMIVHGGTIMALLSRYYGGDYFDYQVENGKGYVCTCNII